MVRRQGFALVAFLILVGCARNDKAGISPAEPAHPAPCTIKIKQRGQGDIFHVEETQTREEYFKAVDEGGKVLLDKKLKVTETSIFRETVLEKKKESKRVTRLQRQYEKAEGRKTDGDAERLPYHGKTVLIELKDGKYRFELEGGQELTGDGAFFLDKEFNKKQTDEFDGENWLLPKKTVDVNESWQLDMEMFTKTLDKSSQMPLDLAKAEGTGKLIRVYKEDNRLFGVFDYHIALPIKEGKLGDGEVLGACKITAHLIVDYCIDGSTFQGSTRKVVELKSSSVGPFEDAKQARVTMNGLQTWETKVKELPTK